MFLKRKSCEISDGGNERRRKGGKIGEEGRGEKDGKKEMKNEGEQEVGREQGQVRRGGDRKRERFTLYSTYILRRAIVRGLKHLACSASN